MESIRRTITKDKIDFLLNAFWYIKLFDRTKDAKEGFMFAKFPKYSDTGKLASKGFNIRLFTKKAY